MGAWIEICNGIPGYPYTNVAPLVGAWIEIFFDVNIVVFDLVAPLVGAWIEIWNQYRIFYDPNMSLPSWERGLKYVMVHPATHT